MLEDVFRDVEIELYMSVSWNVWLQCRGGFVQSSVENQKWRSPIGGSVSVVAFVKSRAPVLWLQKTVRKSKLVA